MKKCSQLYLEGNIYLTKKIENHSDIRMTQCYAKASDELKLNALDML